MGLVNDSDGSLLKQSLRTNGLMEYTSIPWANQAQTTNELPSEWTVNLALWFMHILAGNNFRVGWGYGREDELRLGTLLVNDVNTFSPTTERRDDSTAVSSAHISASEEVSETDSDSSDEATGEYTTDSHPRDPSQVAAAGEVARETQPNTPEQAISFSSFGESPFRKRKRGEDQPNWSFTSKHSSRV